MISLGIEPRSFTRQTAALTWASTFKISIN